MAKSTLADRLAKSQETLEIGLWPQALASAVITVATRDGKITQEALISELKDVSASARTLVTDSPRPLSVGGKHSAEATKRLLEALGSSQDDDLIG